MQFISGRQSCFQGISGSYFPARHSPSPGEENNLAAQVRQAGAHLPLGERGSLSQAGSQASQAFQTVTSQPGAHLPPREGSSLAAGSQPSQASQAVTSQPGAHLPPREGSSLAAGSQSSQASQAGRPVTSPSVKEGGSIAATQPPRQVLTFPLLGNTLPKQVTTPHKSGRQSRY